MVEIKVLISAWNTLLLVGSISEVYRSVRRSRQDSTPPPFPFSRTPHYNIMPMAGSAWHGL